MSRFLVLLYGIVAYVLFLATFLYAIGFVGNLIVPKSIDTGMVSPFGQALLINVLLLGIFAVQHSVMARPGFKKWWTKIIPESIERSTFVLLTNGALILIFWQWRPMTDTVWNLEGSIGGTILSLIFFLGWVIVLLATFMINHFHLFGLQQVVQNWKDTPDEALSFTTRLFYNFIRHPILLGFMIAFWAAPVMSVGHLIFAAVTTVYMLIAIQLEEKDLMAAHGDTYRKYKQQVPMLIPTGKKAS